MIHTLTAFAWRDMIRRPWQTALMLVGVVLGVAVMVSIDVANASARRGFELSTEAVAGGATHQIRGGPGGVPEAAYEALRRELGWQASAPIVEAIAVAPELAGRPLRIVGIDPLADANIRPTFGREAWTLADAARFYLDPRAVIVHAGLAETEGILPGERLRLVVDDRRVDLFVAGVWTPAVDDPGGALQDIVWIDVAAAQELFGMVGRLSRIDLIAGERDLPAIRALLPPGVEVVPASEQTEAVRQLSQAFQLNLTALSLLALVVGMFLIYNSMMFNVVQRRPVLATLSVLGVEPGSIVRVFLAEAAVVGIVGAVVGLPLGWLLAQGAVHLVTQTINDLYFTLSVRQAALLPASAGRAVILSLGAALVAAAGPAIEASHVPPVEAMRRSELEAGAGRWIARLAAAGVLLCLAGGLALAAAHASLA
ncbi:MAG: ABC transporter permease, partial [Anaerolineales bacterium]